MGSACTNTTKAKTKVDGRLLALVVFLGVPGEALAFLLWTWALSGLTPTQVAVYVNLNPVVAALLGIWLLGERRSVAIPTVLAKINCGVHRLYIWVVGQAQSEGSVDLQFVFRFGLLQGGDEVAEVGKDGVDVGR